MPEIPPAFLATAIEAVIHAGDVQMSRVGAAMQIEKKGTIDLVTEVDLECERMCRAVLAERFPDHDILAEEMSRDPGQPSTSQYRWVYDPLDGTTNYAHGLPIFCSSLALQIDGRTVVGAVYDPTRAELFTAERGAGAFLNGQRLHVSAAGELIDSLLVTGFPYDVHKHTADLVTMFAAFLGQARAVRRLGSAALDLCYVAAGRFDAYWEQHLWPWDVAAGALVVTEAGGIVTGMDGSEFDSGAEHLVASNGRVHAAMLNVISDVRQRSLNRTN